MRVSPEQETATFFVRRADLDTARSRLGMARIGARQPAADREPLLISRERARRVGQRSKRPATFCLRRADLDTSRSPLMRRGWRSDAGCARRSEPCRTPARLVVGLSKLAVDRPRCKASPSGRAATCRRRWPIMRGSRSASPSTRASAAICNGSRTSRAEWGCGGPAAAGRKRRTARSAASHKTAPVLRKADRARRSCKLLTAQRRRGPPMAVEGARPA